MHCSVKGNPNECVHMCYSFKCFPGLFLMRLLSWLIQRNLEPPLPAYQAGGVKFASWGVAHPIINVGTWFPLWFYSLPCLTSPSCACVCLVIAVSQATNEAARWPSHAEKRTRGEPVLGSASCQPVSWVYGSAEKGEINRRIIEAVGVFEPWEQVKPWVFTQLRFCMGMFAPVCLRT